MKKGKPKYDNGAFGAAKAIGTFVKETARTAVLKGKIANRQYTNNALRRMRKGQQLTAKDSPSLARVKSGNYKK